ncbi:MAG: GNAT family N-acetyltransferase [Clostridiales bacterium]|nr:GNAT family N-acetyltransferase [Clostridiales bacterium]
MEKRLTRAEEALSVRRLTGDDLPACAEVIRRSFLTVAEEFGLTPENAPRYAAFATTEEALRQRIADPRRPMFACFDGQGRMAGCYGLSDLGNGTCEMERLCVLPALRRRGVGEMLVRHAIKQAREAGFGKITIGIVEENKALKKWYEGFGFASVSTKKYDFFPFTSGTMEMRLK